MSVVMSVVLVVLSLYAGYQFGCRRTWLNLAKEYTLIHKSVIVRPVEKTNGRIKNGKHTKRVGKKASK